MSRKRRRSQAISAEEQHSENNEADVDVNGEGHDSGERGKEHEIWDTFKEEHHEVIEQLPLSLHRQYTLIRELDDQSEAYHANLLETVRKYIALRMQLALRPVTGVGPQQNFSNASDVEVMQVDQLSPSACSPPRDQQDNGDEASSDARKTSPAPSVACSMEPSFIKLPASKETTQTLLQHIAQVSEEALHASEEKVNIAQTAYETVDRHIRLLDQAIKEQETSISLGIRPGTHLAPILLPDLIVPRWARPMRMEHSPTPSLSPEPTTVPLPTEELPGESARPGRGRKARKKPELQPETPPPPPEEVLKIPTTRTTRSVKLKIPAQADIKGPQVAGDSNEPRYCYCNQVSYGTMVACDSDNCKLEWFHLPCIGLSEVPGKRQKWYCQNCLKVTQKGKKR